MAEIRRAFGTKAEAEAFLDGVEYVNDSSIERLRVERDGDEYVAVVWDDDEDDEDDDGG